MGAEEAGRGKVDRVTEKAAQLVLDPEEPESHGGIRLKFDQEIDVAVRASVAVETGTEQSQPPNAVPATQLLKPLLVEFQASENHRENASTQK
jgi:hypothetical protein